MKRNRSNQLAIFFAVAVCLPATVIARKGMWTQPAGFPATVTATAGATPYYYYDPPGTCFGRGRMGRMCHGDKFREWESDQHARAWTADCAGECGRRCCHPEMRY